MKPSLLVLILSVSTLAAQSQSPKEVLSNASSTQESLGRMSKEIQAQLGEIRQEMADFLPERAAALDASDVRMRNLAEGELADAAAQLREAASAPDATARQKSLEHAGRNQFKVEMALNGIWSDLGGTLDPDRQSSKTLNEALKTLRETARRQSVVRMETQRLESHPDPQRMKVLAGEQQHFAIVAEQVASNLGDNELASSFLEEAKSAARSLREGDLESASAEQEKILQTMQDLAKSLDPVKDEPDIDELRQLKRKLDGVANMQNDVARHMAAGNMDAAMEWQNRAAMTAASLAPALAESTPSASEALKRASASMEKVADAMSKGDKAAASSLSSATSNDLAQAINQMGEQLASMDTSSSASAKAQAAQQIGRSAKAKGGGGMDSSKPQGSGSLPGSGMGGGLGKSSGDLKSSGNSGEIAQTNAGLNPAERAAASQVQAVKPPLEFSADVGQYFKNLADGVKPVNNSQP